MGTKITKQILAARLKKEGKWTSAQIDAYVDAFFNVLHEGVTNEGTVKLKGLGTFKTIQVADRASVDVNTGERIVIPGHQKLKFVEEEKVNALLNNTEQEQPVKEVKPVKEAQPAKAEQPAKEEQPAKAEQAQPAKEESTPSEQPQALKEEVKKSSSRWWIWALIALAIVLLVVGVIVSINSGNTDDDAATQTEQKSANQPSQPKAPTYKIHSFQKGESLTTISVLYYGTTDSVERIQQLNGLSDTSEIALGAELKLP